ncbi:unnamed protein product [Adineta ricciae]|uniref:Ig-like domain-containing protein n=1 Tax=Adineta ricciae TaxID=249248 RepID=A0A816E156_ADIRI|nr:unnamed protein product [Adineta ricciae]
MSNFNINSSCRTLSDLIIIYLIILSSSLSFTTNAATMRVSCGTDIELKCPIRSTKNSYEVISWFRPNSSHSHLTLIAIGDILFSEYATIGRYNLVSSSSSSTPRLLISNVSREDQGIYACKSSSSGQHSIKLLVNSHPHLTPPSPLFLYPVNRTFTLTCSLSCDSEIHFDDLTWLVNGQLLNQSNYDFHTEPISSNTQRLTIFFNKKTQNFHQANYTCRYNGKEAHILVRRRTKDEFHRLPRQQDASAQYLFQSLFNAGQIRSPSVFLTMIFLLLSCIY